MIGFLRGTLVRKQPPLLYLEVHGVGYEVSAPMTTFYRLPAEGGEVLLHTHLHVREDAQLLYGFATEDERRLFRALIKVTGVGAKMALTILSGIEAEEFAACVREGDAARLVHLPGIGRKTAERLVVEMRDKLKDLALGQGQPTSAPAHGGSAAVNEAISALIALGYKPQEASRYVHAVAADGMDSETIIRESLKTSLR